MRSLLVVVIMLSFASLAHSDSGRRYDWSPLQIRALRGFTVEDVAEEREGVGGIYVLLVKDSANWLKVEKELQRDLPSWKQISLSEHSGIGFCRVNGLSVNFIVEAGSGRPQTIVANTVGTSSAITRILIHFYAPKPAVKR